MLPKDFESNPTDRLKKAWKHVNKFIVKNDYKSVVEFIECFLYTQYDVQILRMLLDSTSMVRDEPLIISVREKLIELIEHKIDKKLH